MIAEGGIYIEDYSDIEEQVEQIAHVDLIEQELLDKPRDTVIIHMYLEPGASPVETLALIAARMEAAGIPYTSETEGVEQEDWQNGWRKYYHPMDVGQRLAIVPSWQDYDTDRVKLILDPGLAFGTGGHETTNLCLEVLDERVKGGERVLDIGTGSGILAIAALKLGAAVAEGVDIDPVAVRTAGENAALNGVADKLTVLVGDLSDKASGKYDIITANIVANAIMSLAPAVPGLMADDAVFIASGIIDSRKDEVVPMTRKSHPWATNSSAVRQADGTLSMTPKGVFFVKGHAPLPQALAAVLHDAHGGVPVLHLGHHGEHHPQRAPVGGAQQSTDLGLELAGLAQAVADAPQAQLGGLHALIGVRHGAVGTKIEGAHGHRAALCRCKAGRIEVELLLLVQNTPGQHHVAAAQQPHALCTGLHGGVDILRAEAVGQQLKGCAVPGVAGLAAQHPHFFVFTLQLTDAGFCLLAGHRVRVKDAVALGCVQNDRAAVAVVQEISCPPARCRGCSWPAQ